MTQRAAIRYEVYRSGLLTTALEVLSISESAGVAHLDTAHLIYKDATLEGRSFYDSLMGDEIEIKNPATGSILHWGKVSVIPPVLNSQTEQLIVVSRAERFHLGERVNGVWCWNPLQASEGGGDPVGGPELIADDMVFNPIIDGKVYGNANDTYSSNGSDPMGETDHQLFLDPESVRTTAATTLHGGAAPVKWLIADAVQYLLRTLNADATNVANPDYSDILAAFDAADDDGLQNLTIPRGTYLADALDMLLEPFGYRWRVKRTAVGARIYEFFHHSSGTAVNVYHQPIGSALDTGLQNMEALGLAFDAANLFNEVTIVGGPYAYEFTVELARGWAESHDTADVSLLAKTAPDFSTRKDAWRRWVLNEAGDYIGLRPEIDGVFTSAFRTALEAEYTDLIWAEFVPRRRKMLPTLTLGDDHKPIGEHRGIVIEYRNTTEAAWRPIGNWGAQIIDNECAIYFDGELPPTEYEFKVEDRANIRLRATFTLVSDKRLEATSLHDGISPQPDVAPLLIDAPQKFRHQEVSPISQYYASGRPTLTAVDTTAIAAFADRVRQVWDLLDIGGALQLEGLDAADGGNEYEIGQRVQGVVGKGIDFRAKTGVDEWPQIVAIERHVMNQTTTLHLQRIKRTISFGGDIVRNNRLGRRGRR